MEHQDKKLEIWREAIPRMNEEDLEFILGSIKIRN